MSRRFQILTAQAEAARKAEQERRAKFADKAARYTVGKDAFCRGDHIAYLVDGKQITLVEGMSVKHPSGRYAVGDDAFYKSLGDCFDILRPEIPNAPSLDSPAPTLPDLVGPFLTTQRPSWRTATKQWHRGPPPHEGAWIASAYRSEICFRYFADGEWGLAARSAHAAVAGLGYPATPHQEAIEWFGYAPDADGWIKWDGGECPVLEGVRVEIMQRVSKTAGVGAHPLWWSHRGHPVDILAYRVVK